jgi:periplasmic copper chaperone A
VSRRIVFVLAILLGAVACGAESKPIAVTDAWICLPAPGLSVAAGYFDIVNRTATPIDLIGASSDAAASIEIHTELHDGEVMQMRQLDVVALAPKQTVSFTPGGTHLMLLGYSGVTSITIPITLRFSDGSQQTVSFEVHTLTGERTQ